MAELVVDDTHVEVVLSTMEQLGALRRTMRVPLSSVVNVEYRDEARSGMSGLRAPGTALPGGIKLGTWRSRTKKTFVATSGKQPGYVIDLSGESVDRLVVASPRIKALDSLAN